MNTEDRLFDELENARWFAMAQLADLAEEQGQTALALGYRWLAGKQKYPKRQRDRGDLIKRWAWGQAFNHYSDGDHKLPHAVYLICKRKTANGPKILVKKAAEAAGSILIQGVEIK